MKVLESSTKIGLKNFLFLTDFSEASQSAMQYAAILAKHHAAAFYAAHVCTPTSPVYIEGAALVRYFDEVREQKREELTKLVEPLGLSPQLLISEGMIEHAIERWTALHGIDLIVIGTHGWRGLQRLLQGSIAELILRSATYPVLTVGPHVPHRSHPVRHRSHTANRVRNFVCSVVCPRTMRAPDVAARGRQRSACAGSRASVGIL